MPEGLEVHINGEVVYETDENVINVQIGSNRGEITNVGARADGVDRIYINISKEPVLNRHLDSVDRERIAERRERVADSPPPTPVEEELSVPHTSADTTTETTTETTASTSGSFFGSNDDNEDSDE